MPIPGDLRAWDGLISGRNDLTGVETEMRPHDLQALQRRIALKQRDSGVPRVILLVPSTRINRGIVREYADLLHEWLPVPGSAAVASLEAGRHPDGNALVML